MEQFTYVKRGYDPEEVDRYIATLEQVIKSYKEKDNAIKNAIISAQVAADNMIKNAKNQADEYKGQIAKELDKITTEIERQRIRVQAFQDVYSGLVRKYLTTLDDNDMSDLFTRLDDVDKLITRLKETDIVPPTVTPEPMDTAPAPSLSKEEAAVFAGNPAPAISFGPENSPSLNKPAARVNDEGNYVPNA
ncbi:MAG: DivIVA domain-containing protein [Defluviitaleaceae bacterium]|nr:DivIVA domain-containing protein [Defluviitaleaceae bacterium]